MPDICRFIIVEIDGDVQAVTIESKPLLVGKEFPGPGYRFTLEVVTKAEVSQHFEECVMVGRSPHIIDITCTQAFLTARCTGEV